MKAYFTRPLLTIFALGFSSGLPLLLVWSTLTAWLFEMKVDIAAIGLFAAVRSPYSLKFLWAPVIDSLSVPLLTRMLGRRRGWLALTQLCLTGTIALLAFARPDISPWATAACALLVAFFSASQDIVIDGYRIEILKEEEQGEGAAMIQLGYRLGMITAGAGALYLASYIGWQGTYFAMAALMGMGIVTTLVAHEPQTGAQVTTHSPAQWVKTAVIEPFADFMRRDQWWLVLLFIVLYKLADAFMGGVTTPFFLDIGFDKKTLANIVKIFGVGATLLGIFIGGTLTERYGAIRILFLAGILHALTNLLLVAQAYAGANATLLAVSIAAENLSGGISAAAFVAYLSGLTNVHYTATQYALLSSLAAFGTTWLSTPAGYLVKAVGWGWFFAFAASLAIPGLMVLWILSRRITATSPQGAAT